VLKDLESLIAPTVMAIIFVAVVVTILRSQNPQRRAEAKQRERAAEEADPRIDR
jgi:cbb3-type cytochrome oxidase subunit 3